MSQARGSEIYLPWPAVWLSSSSLWATEEKPTQPQRASDEQQRQTNAERSAWENSQLGGGETLHPDRSHALPIPVGLRWWRCSASWATVAAAPQGTVQPIVLTGGLQDRVQFSGEEWAALWWFHQSCFYNGSKFYPQTVTLWSTTAGLL